MRDMRSVVGLLAMLCILSPMQTFAGDVPDSFKGYVAYQLGWNSLFLAPELAEKAKVVYESPSEERASTIVFPLGKTSVSMSFDPGPSEDPTFVIDLGAEQEYLMGETLYVSSSGSFYLEREMNEYFEKRLKFSISNGKLEEVRQPFYRVDRQCEASTVLRMYEGPCNQGQLIATLPKGSTVDILVMNNAEG